MTLVGAVSGCSIACQPHARFRCRFNRTEGQRFAEAERLTRTGHRETDTDTNAPSIHSSRPFPSVSRRSSLSAARRVRGPSLKHQSVSPMPMPHAMPSKQKTDWPVPADAGPLLRLSRA